MDNRLKDILEYAYAVKFHIFFFIFSCFSYSVLQGVLYPPKVEPEIPPGMHPVAAEVIKYNEAKKKDIYVVAYELFELLAGYPIVIYFCRYLWSGPQPEPEPEPEDSEDEERIARPRRNRRMRGMRRTRGIRGM